MEVTDGVLLERNQQGVIAVIVPAPAAPETRPLVGDGWTLTLRAGWRVVPGERAGDWAVRRIQ